jgi:hypothetical protein
LNLHRLCGALAATALICAASLAGAGQKPGQGYVKVFDGKTLNGWTLMGGVGPGYVPNDGVLVVPKDGGGNLYTEKEYSDFAFKFEFKLESGSNNGIALRAPLSGDSAYMGMESQVLDDTAPMYANLEPGQYHSSIYKVVAAKRGSLKPVGQWNSEEITAVGRHIKIVVNGKVTVDANLNDVTDPKVFAEHPGFRRDRGHIGFLGHGPAEVQFRNIYLKDLSKPEKDNTPPDGFVRLFNGKDLKGWKGLVADPPHRAKMSAEELASQQKKADEAAFQHWKVEDGEIVYDGKNNNLCTTKDYADFEMLVDWKIEKEGDSGIYLRGSPQLQIWDPDNHPGRPGEGSGGLYNNEKNPNGPSKRADKPVGEWNRFRILMIGDKVTVHLNDELVVRNVTMENYWERDKPMYPTGQIELQHHGAPLYFKNIFIRELPRK